MPFGAAPALPVSVEQRVELVRLSKSASLPHRTVVQVRGYCWRRTGSRKLTDRGLRRGVFTGVPGLTQAITTWAGHWNSNPAPFIWEAAAEDIITRVKRGRGTLDPIRTQAGH
jgi:hypothetical protein